MKVTAHDPYCNGTFRELNATAVNCTDSGVQLVEEDPLSALVRESDVDNAWFGPWNAWETCNEPDARNSSKGCWELRARRCLLQNHALRVSQKLHAGSAFASGPTLLPVPSCLIGELWTRRLHVRILGESCGE